MPGRAEQPLVRAQGEAVGHARHVVGDLGDAVGVGVPEARGQVLGMLEVVVHEPPDDLDGLVVVAALHGAEVDALEHEVAQLVHDAPAIASSMRTSPASRELLDDGVDHAPDPGRARAARSAR